LLITLDFGADFNNRRLVPNRVEFLNMLQKVQVIEHFVFKPFLP